MSFALKPIDKRIQQVLEEKSKILSRDTAALKIQAGGMSDKLKEMQSRSTWIRWISGEENPAVILGGMGINDGGVGYSLAKGFKQVYCPPGSEVMQYSPTQTRKNAKSGMYLETSKPYFKPVAGVKSVTTSFEGATKALRKTTVTWTVFDLAELEILTPHFLTPGKWSMLEIGWNYDKKSFKNLVGDKLFDIKSATAGEPAKAKYDNFEDLGSLDEIIYQNRGDYDVFTGIITNFEYSVRDDGGFDCTTTLSTHGISLLDAGKDTTTFTVDAALSKTETTDDPVKITNLSQDNINIAMQKLATYFRVTVTKGARFKLNKNFKLAEDFYGPKDNTNWFTYVGVKGNTINEGEDDEEFKGLKKSRSSSDYTAALIDDMMAVDTPAASWVRWGWFEDNILSKYAGYATMNIDEEGKITGIKEVKLKFRSIDDVLTTVDGTIGQKVKISDTEKYEKESVRILSHKKILTTDVNKFILIGKTDTLEQEQKNSVYPKLGAFLNNSTSLKKYNFKVEPKPGEKEPEIEEGYIRNIFFNVRWIQEQFEGVGTLKEALDNIWNSFNTEYQNYWQFDVVGDVNDLSLARLTDKNNSRYSVSEFKISEINLKNKTQSRYGCYKFPTWTKDSIVSNMDYSVTIPSSQVAVAALSGGSLDAEKIAQRNRGNIDVQTFVKGMHKSFEDSKERFFDNVTRIAEHSNVSTVAKFGNKDADENGTLIAGNGPDIIRKLYERDKDLIKAINKGETGSWPSGKPIEESVIIKSAHEFFKTPTKYSPNPKDWPKLYEDGAIQSDGTLNYKSTMLGVMHTSPRESKGALTDLLNGIAELKLTIDGTAGIFPGDAFTSHHLPNHLLKKGKNGELPLLFQVTNVQQTLNADGWKTEITGQPRMNHNHIYDKSKTSKEESLIANLRGEISSGAVTKEGVFTRLFENRNILGINQEYLSKHEMFQGITKIRNDEYLGDLATTKDDSALGSWRDHLGVVEDKGKVTWSSKSGDYTIKLNHFKRATPAIFKGKRIEEVMRFAMYNGILYSMPDEKLHNSKLAPYTSIDKTFQCLSYNLFKGDKPNMSRYETDGEDKFTQPSYTQQYIKQMQDDLNKFSSLHHGFGGNKSGEGKVAIHGIRGLYTPMAILRRGKDIMRKFMWDEGDDITEGDKAAWDAAKDYQELFTFKYVTTMDITTAWFDGKLDGDRDIFNLTINGNNAVVYKIWFDFFKCMFISYLGDAWEKDVQLIEHPKWVKPNVKSTVLKERLGYYKTWKHDEEGLEESGKIVKLDKFKGKKGLYTSEGLALINLFTEENMFVGGVDHFSVDNEIHKFLKHMTDVGFDLSPEVMYFRSHDISMGNNNTDWWTAVMNKSIRGWKHTKKNKWDSKYKYKSANASHELWPYGDAGEGKITRPGHYEVDNQGKSTGKWVDGKKKLD